MNIFFDEFHEKWSRIKKTHEFESVPKNVLEFDNNVCDFWIIICDIDFFFANLKIIIKFKKCSQVYKNVHESGNSSRFS